MDGAWDENAVTWNNQPASAGTPGTAPSRSSAGYLEIDVRWQLQSIYESGANHGFLIRDAAENHDAEQQFYSREKGQDPPQLGSMVHEWLAGEPSTLPAASVARTRNSCAPKLRAL